MQLAYSPEDIFYRGIFFLNLFLDRGEGKEKHINVLLLFVHPYWTPGLQPRHVPWLGIEPVTLMVRRPALNPLSHTSQGSRGFLKSSHFPLQTSLFGTSQSSVLTFEYQIMSTPSLILRWLSFLDEETGPWKACSALIVSFAGKRV